MQQEVERDMGQDLPLVIQGSFAHESQQPLVAIKVTSTKTPVDYDENEDEEQHEEGKVSEAEENTDKEEKQSKIDMLMKPGLTAAIAI
ncbi:hypothetical protein CHS0354_022378 [Potamilus streckersoni]|uniref:Uncharacterized protein n=1 Tax=Potamilus streckersoni TaxID=2493646 RepID=A0AAE0SX41_9BIVA|nr:hypothetical protein CHS0354_022378 [Potamilus streckersoni]